MSTRPAIPSRSFTGGRRHSPAPAALVSFPARSNTPTRFNSPRNRQPVTLPMPVETSRSGTPTPQGRPRNHGRKRGESRKQQQHSPQTPIGSDPDTPNDTEEDSEELFQLLGINGEDEGVDGAAAPKGFLRLTKENMDSALGNSASKKKHPRTKNKPSDRQDGRNSSPTPVGRKQRVKGANNKAAIAEPSPDALDMSSMSRSLPASFFAENQHANGKVDPAKWDMPAPTGGQELNWQQQLRAADTPKRSPRSQPVDGNSRRRNKQADAAPRQHDRHQSLEDVPVSNLTKMMASVGPHSASANGVPHSAFDSSIPFHTGFNVHRAPQTPVRTAGLRSTSSSRSPAGAISLPIVGEFPRINKSGAPLGGQKYAGPTFHNSPASGSLPQPDLDDF